MSVATLSRSSDRLRDVYGRGMNVHSDVYKLPADAEEHDRLTRQHRVWKSMLGGTGLYPPEVEDTLQRLLFPDRTGTGGITSPPAILDLGSGSGIWVVDMAAKFPHAKVVGLDLAEPQLQKELFPPNCSFVTTDLTKGLDAYRESFDVVHCRCVAGHVMDRIQLMREIAKVLKPGGLLLLADGNVDLYNSDGSLVPPISSEYDLETSSCSSQPRPRNMNNTSEAQSSYLATWFKQFTDRVISATYDPEHAGGKCVGWLVQQEDQFEYLGERAYFSPLRLPRRSEEDDSTAERRQEREREEELARCMARNIIDYLLASKPGLMSSGIPPGILDDWLSRAQAELLEQSYSTETWLMVWHMAWAVKKVPEPEGGS